MTMKKLILFSILACAFTCFLAAQNKKQQPAGGAAAKASIDRGKTVYTTYCIACHQADGNGVPNLNPPLAQTSYVLGDKKKLAGIVLKGMNEEVEINGNYFSNNMPPQQFLKDQEIADVLTYVRNNFTNKASAVTVAEVAATRKALGIK